MILSIKKQGYPLSILIIVTIIIIGRIFWITHGDVPLNSEEAQYWLWSKHLDFSYYSKPPLIAYLNFVSTHILGNTEIGIRINAILIGFIIPFIHYKLAWEIFNDEKIAFWSVIVLLVMPHYNITSLFFTTDSLVFLFWSLAMLYGVKLCKNNSRINWILLGISCGLGMMSKYTMVLWFPLFVFVAARQKFMFWKDKWFYVSLLISILICIPLIYWNIKHHFVGVKHILGLVGVYKTQGPISRSIGRFFEYIGGQIACISPFFLLAFISVYNRWKNRKLYQDQRGIDLLITPLLAVWVIFLAISIQRSEINWTFFALTPLPLLIAYSFIHFHNIKYRIISITLTFAIMSIILFPFIIDNLNLKKIYPPSIDPYKSEANWPKLGKKVSAIIKEMGDKKIILTSENYHITSALAFYVEGQPQTYCIHSGTRRMNQFDLWDNIEKFKNSEYSILYITDVKLSDSIKNIFPEIHLLDKQPQIYRGEKIDNDFKIYHIKKINSYAQKAFYSY